MHRDILFVDDELLLLAYMERSLRGSFNIFTAMSGHKGLELISDRPEPFPVVVADLRMPGMDGLEFIEAALEKSPKTEFLVLTGCARGFDVSEAVDRGGVSVLISKPCSPPLLRLAIEHAIQRYELASCDNAWDDRAPYRSSIGEALQSSDTRLHVAPRPLEFYMLEPRMSLTRAEWVNLIAGNAAPLSVP